MKTVTGNDIHLLDEYQKVLIGLAQVARKKAYAPHSRFKVGAAIKQKGNDETMFRGCNVENSILLVTHAEQAAVSQMILMRKGEHSVPVIEAIAVALVAENEHQHALPCGFCRQLIREFGADETVILGAKLTATGEVWAVEVTTLGELLPLSFGANNLIL